MIKIYQPGTQVVFINAASKEAIDETLPFGTIIEVVIKADLSVEYLVCWWSGNTRCTALVKELEFVEASNSEKMTIGFKNG